MGTWGVGPFDNDTATDLVAAIKDGSFNMSQLRFECGRGPLSAQQAEIVIALGALLAGESPEGTDLAGVDKQFTYQDRRWVTKHIRRAMTPGESEIYALWEDTGEIDEWLRATTRVMP